jgi:predicted O-methyltransferase YrrM
MIDDPKIREVLDDLRGTVTAFKGGLPSDEMLNCIASMVTPEMTTVETGCGLTTLVFAMRSGHHTCIDPQEGKTAAIASAVKERGGEVARPRMMPSLEYWQYGEHGDDVYDFALMDGDDVSPGCVFDAVYLATRVKPGGHIMIDDVSQPWIKTALAVLDAWSGWEVARPVGSRSVLYRRDR